VNEWTRWRFTRNRRDELIQRIGGGPPNARQALAIDMMIKNEWAEHVADHDAAIAPDAKTRVRALQVAENARKQVLLWNRELTAATPPPAVETPPSLDELKRRVIAERDQRRREAAA
jgi:hypothetical protein